MRESKFLKLLKLRKYIPFKFLKKIVDIFIRIIFSCDIPYTVKLGNNIILPHFGLGVVIHPRTKIGDNCKIFQQVTIGCRNGEGPPILGDNVYIGSGAKVLGNIRIGNNVKIGANAVILHDIPDGSVVVGIPGKIV